MKDRANPAKRMTREDKWKLVVACIENMVAVHIAINNNKVGYSDRGSVSSAENARQELLSALIQMDADIFELTYERGDASELERLRKINLDLVENIVQAIVALREDPPAVDDARAMLAMCFETAGEGDVSRQV